MAECQAKDEIEEILKCQLCKTTVREPMRLKCLHAYCSNCLDNMPKLKQGKQTGWMCQSCEFFTDEQEVREDKLLVQIIAMETDACTRKTKICEFCEDLNDDLMYCTDCRMTICGRCKRSHEKTPVTRHHEVGTLDDIPKGIIDEVIYCPKHGTQILETYCNTCDKMFCKYCLNFHNKHDMKTTDVKLQELDTEMSEYTKNIAIKMKTADRQLASIDKEIDDLKETYAEWRMVSDLKLEKLINRLKASKASMDEEVNEEESRNIERLTGIRTKVKNQRERLRIVKMFADLTKIKTQHLSRLMELQSGLYSHAKELNKEEVYSESLQLTTPLIHDEFFEPNDEVLAKMLWQVKYENTDKIIDQCGLVLQQFEYRCKDFNQYLNQQFEITETTQISDEWCNRLSKVDQSLYTGHGLKNCIKQYNMADQSTDRYKNVHNTIVSRQVNNGDIIAGGYDGLYITRKSFTEWTYLQQGQYCDVAIHGNHFTTLDFQHYRVSTFQLCHNNDAYIWTHKSAFQIPKNRSNYVFNSNSTIIVDKESNVIVCSINTLLLYSPSGECMQNIQQLSGSFTIFGSDRQGNIGLCNYQSGEIFIVNKIQEFNSCEEACNYLCKKYIRDIIIDRDGNMWTLHGNIPFFLTKYVPLE